MNVIFRVVNLAFLRVCRNVKPPGMLPHPPCVTIPQDVSDQVSVPTFPFQGQQESCLVAFKILDQPPTPSIFVLSHTFTVLSIPFPHFLSPSVPPMALLSPPCLFHPFSSFPYLFHPSLASSVPLLAFPFPSHIFPTSSFHSDTRFHEVGSA